MHIAVTLYNGSIKVSDNGKMNKANPVTLFNVLCMDSSSFLRTKTYPYRTVIMGESSFKLVISYCGDRHVRNLMDVFSFPIGQFYFCIGQICQDVMLWIVIIFKHLANLANLSVFLKNNPRSLAIALPP